MRHDDQVTVTQSCWALPVLQDVLQAQSGDAEASAGAASPC